MDKTTPGFYEKVSDFGRKKYGGGVIAKAGRKIDWMDGHTGRGGQNLDRGKNADQGPKLYMPKSTLGSTHTARIGATPRFRDAQYREEAKASEPGPGSYNVKPVHKIWTTRANQGVSFKKGGRQPKVALAGGVHSWYHQQDTPGPAAYAPMSVADAKKKKAEERYFNSLSKLSRSVAGTQPNTARSYRGGGQYEFTPRTRQ